MRNLKRALSLTLASVMLLGMMVVGSSAAGYPDVDDEDNVEAIEVLQAIGVMVGDDNGNFGTDDQVTRAQMAVIMAKLMNLNTYITGTNPFNDVPDWAAPSVAACYTNGIISGYGDGRYGSNDPVTAVQAASMLMRALGYFQRPEDVKDGFELATIRQAGRIDLFNDVETSKAGDNLTRNQVAQIVLNTLKSGMVEPDDGNKISVNVDGVQLSVGATKYVYVVSREKYATSIRTDRASANDTTGLSGAFIVDLGEKLYQGDLTLNSTKGDDLGRPANHWEYKTKEIGTYAADPDYEFSSKVTYKKMYDTVGSVAASNYEWSVYSNGELVTGYNAGKAGDSSRVLVSNRVNDDKCFLEKFEKELSKCGTLTGNGVITEIFVDDTEETEIGTGTVTVAVYNLYAAEIMRVDEKDGTVILTDLGQGPATAKHDIEAEGFKEDDVVVYTFSESADKLQSVKAAERIEGEITRVRTDIDGQFKDDEKNGDQFVVDGKTYGYNKTVPSGDRLQTENVNNNMVGYLDEFGNCIYIDKAAISYDYAYVLSAGVDTDRYGSEAKDQTIYARLAFTDGTVASVETDNKAGDYYKDGKVTFVEQIVSYSKDSKGIYTLTPANNYYHGEATTNDAPDLEIGNNVSGFTAEAKNRYSANSRTAFVVVDTDKKSWTGYNYTAYEGVANVPDVDGDSDTKIAVATEKNSKVAKVVFILDGNVSGGEVYFIRAASDAQLVKDSALGDYYLVNAWVDGEAVTLNVKTETSAADALVRKIDGGIAMGLNPSSSTKKIVAADTITKNSDGLVTGVHLYDTKNLVKDGDGVVIGAGTDKTNRNTIVLGNNNVDAVTRYTYTDDAVFVQYNNRNEIKSFEASRANAIKRDANDKYIAVLDGDTIVGICVYYVAGRENEVIVAANGATITKDGEVTTELLVGDDIVIKAPAGKKIDKVDGAEENSDGTWTVTGALVVYLKDNGPKTEATVTVTGGNGAVTVDKASTVYVGDTFKVVNTDSERYTVTVDGAKLVAGATDTYEITAAKVTVTVTDNNVETVTVASGETYTLKDGETEVAFKITGANTSTAWVYFEAGDKYGIQHPAADGSVTVVYNGTAGDTVSFFAVNANVLIGGNAQPGDMGIASYTKNGTSQQRQVTVYGAGEAVNSLGGLAAMSLARAATVEESNVWMMEIEGMDQPVYYTVDENGYVTIDLGQIEFDESGSAIVNKMTIDDNPMGMTAAISDAEKTITTDTEALTPKVPGTVLPGTVMVDGKEVAVTWYENGSDEELTGGAATEAGKTYRYAVVVSGLAAGEWTVNDTPVTVDETGTVETDNTGEPIPNEPGEPFVVDIEGEEGTYTVEPADVDLTEVPAGTTVTITPAEGYTVKVDDGEPTTEAVEITGDATVVVEVATNPELPFKLTVNGADVTYGGTTKKAEELWSELTVDDSEATAQGGTIYVSGKLKNVGTWTNFGNDDVMYFADLALEQTDTTKYTKIEFRSIHSGEYRTATNKDGNTYGDGKGEGKGPKTLTNNLTLSFTGKEKATEKVAYLRATNVFNNAVGWVIDCSGIEFEEITPLVVSNSTYDPDKSLNGWKINELQSEDFNAELVGNNIVLTGTLNLMTNNAWGSDDGNWAGPEHEEGYFCAFSVECPVGGASTQIKNTLGTNADKELSACYDDSKTHTIVWKIANLGESGDVVLGSQLVTVTVGGRPYVYVVDASGLEFQAAGEGDISIKASTGAFKSENITASGYTIKDNQANVEVTKRGNTFYVTGDLYAMKENWSSSFSTAANRSGYYVTLDIDIAGVSGATEYTLPSKTGGETEPGTKKFGADKVQNTFFLKGLGDAEFDAYHKVKELKVTDGTNELKTYKVDFSGVTFVPDAGAKPVSASGDIVGLGSSVFSADGKSVQLYRARDIQTDITFTYDESSKTFTAHGTLNQVKDWRGFSQSDETLNDGWFISLGIEETTLTFTKQVGTTKDVTHTLGQKDEVCTIRVADKNKEPAAQEFYFQVKVSEQDKPVYKIDLSELVLNDEVATPTGQFQTATDANIPAIPTKD